MSISPGPTSGVLLAVLAALLGVAAGLGALIGAAAITDRPPLFLLAGLLAFSTAYFLGLLFATRGIAPSQRRRLRMAPFCAGTAVVVGLFAWTALLPMGDPRLRPPPPRGNASGSFRPDPGSPTSMWPPRTTPGSLL